MRLTDPEIRERTQVSPGWGIAFGILMVILGLIAIARPLYAAVAATLVFGWVFILAGVGQIIYAFQHRRGGHLAWNLILGALYLLAGILLVANPLEGVLTLALVLGITIFVQSVIQVVVAFRIRRVSRNWGWLLASGILGIILGIFIWSAFPFNADWIVGVWIGINLLFDGIWMLLLSSGDRTAV